MEKRRRIFKSTTPGRVVCADGAGGTVADKQRQFAPGQSATGTISCAAPRLRCAHPSRLIGPIGVSKSGVGALNVAKLSTGLRGVVTPR